ncbi:MAG: hypothetical protein WAJ91_16925, partial [Rhodoplanes sp.]
MNDLPAGSPCDPAGTFSALKHCISSRKASRHGKCHQHLRQFAQGLLQPHGHEAAAWACSFQLGDQGSAIVRRIPLYNADIQDATGFPEPVHA